MLHILWFGVTINIQEDLLKAEIYRKEMKDKFVKDCLEPCKKFSIPIKRLKLKVYKNVHKKILLKISDKRLIKYKQQGNLQSWS